jgi:3-hydroxybutyryl-CoA dehydrogenase
MEIKTIAVIGSGIMGSGIAQVAAAAGLNVRLRDIKDEFLDHALATIETSLGRMVKKGKLGESEKAGIINRINPTTELKPAVEGVDYVIEAVPEILELKLEVFRELDALASKHVILATNTSQFRITSIAAATKRPEKVVGTHFFNPPVMRRFVEIIRGLDTSDETLQTTLDLFMKLDMETIVCQKDSAGFITTRLLSLWVNEAQRIYEEGLATVEDIDKACRLAFGHPMGPLETSDFTGLDTGLHVRKALFNTLGERYRPTQTLINLVEGGHLGRKSGRGYYSYKKTD